MACSLMIGASTCKDGCKYLRGRLQVLASEMGKTGTEIVSPILDKRKGRRDTPPYGSLSPLHDQSGEPKLACVFRLLP